MSNTLGDGVLHLLGFLMGVGVFALAIAQLVAGVSGIAHHLGITAAVIAGLLFFFARFTLPITVGAFFGAMDVWGWQWYWALAFTLPGLALMAIMIPGVLVASLPWKRNT